jgi:UDP-glucose-4-epimerase GalE
LALRIHGEVNNAGGLKVRILVTGGAGYVGSHAAKALHRAGFEPIVLDNLSEGHRWAVKWGPLVEADLQDVPALKRAIGGYEISGAMHFAAHAYVGESVRKPRNYFDNNVINTFHLLHALLDAGVRNFVFSSSCAVYGAPQSLPISEAHPKVPVNPYGESKLFVERVLDWYGRAYGLRWSALRYFNAAGADPEGELGEVHNPETHLIPRILDVALGKLKSVEIYGSDYPTKDGTAVRDYVHVSDLADAHVASLRHLLSGGASFAANLGTGCGASVREVIVAAQRVSGANLDVSLSPRRPGDPAELVADARHAQSLLGWRPKFSELGDIVASAWDWHRRRASDLSAGTLPRK